MTTTQNTTQFKDYLAVAGITLLIILGLPILALIGLSLQFGFLIIAPIILLSALAYAFGSRTQNTDVKVRGITVPMDLFFHKGHSWFKRNTNQNVLIGLDDFGQRLIGPTDMVEVMKVGKHIKEGEPIAILKRGKNSIKLPSPVQGLIVRINPMLKDDPEMVNRAPYSRGWLVEVKPEGAFLSSPGLLRGGNAVDWMRTEIDRLVAIISNVHAEVTCLPDGGEVMGRFSESLDQNTLKRVLDTFFS